MTGMDSLDLVNWTINDRMVCMNSWFLMLKNERKSIPQFVYLSKECEKFE